MKIKRSSHLTLLELVISIAIVAAFASILLDNFADEEFRARERQTHTRGLQVQTLMNGQSNTDGISRFLSDMGRFPKVYIDPERDEEGEIKKNRYLAQLYDPKVWYYASEDNTQLARTVNLTVSQTMLDLEDAPTFSNYNFPRVSFSVGWRGPYLSLPYMNTNTFEDGWGRPWEIVTNFHRDVNNHKLVEDYEIATPSSTYTPEIEGIISYGADGAEDGTASMDKDNVFLFPYEDQLASLDVCIKVRDEFDPTKWNDFTTLTSSIYLPGTTYPKGAVVSTNINGVDHYYTSQIVDNTLQPNLTISDTTPNGGWKYGVPANVVSGNATRILLFSPALRGKTNGTFEGGFFRLSPYTDDETNSDLLYPSLKYCEETSGGAQVFGTDEDVKIDPDDPSAKSIGKINGTRSRVVLDWKLSPEQKVPSFLRIERLVPGRRILYGFSGFNESTNYFSKCVCEPVWIDLKPGENHITLYFEWKH